MIKKPELTLAQKQEFQRLFDLLVMESSEELQKLWNTNSTITWDLGGHPFIPNNIHSKLKGKQADKFVILMNKFNDRRL
ncbi:MAG: hypothetical protein P0Y49_14480 [Candidatus Pedobacter colombiensis]|uniref:Uncharacterized protein n=1 Tax=Candidatus Pedobacter colombiensis TaxID=3121371 RepID=A0AAJ6B5B5_9SPHI|nr:hypothetical protein [Pedobacter sp.]WEK18000.1 MAG: hypothetical protein P0Y49_14480 [Pedobacter sp.]